MNELQMRMASHRIFQDTFILYNAEYLLPTAVERAHELGLNTESDVVILMANLSIW